VRRQKSLRISDRGIQWRRIALALRRHRAAQSCANLRILVSGFDAISKSVAELESEVAALKAQLDDSSQLPRWGGPTSAAQKCRSVRRKTSTSALAATP